MKKTAILTALSAALLLSACNDADVASRNLSTAADNFQIARRIVFYNTENGHEWEVLAATAQSDAEKNL